MLCTLSPWVPLTPAAAGEGSEVQVLERPQRAQVEDAAQVDVEAIAALAGEHHAVALDGVDGLGGERRVVGGAEWARC